MLILVLEVHPAVVATREEQRDHHSVEVDRKEQRLQDQDQPQNEPLEDQDQHQEELQNVQSNQNHAMVQNMNLTTA